MNRTIKAKPVKKESKAKKTLFETLKGLFSNAQVVENGKTHPFWLPLILAILAVVLALTPIMVAAGSASGGSVLSSNTYGFDNAASYVLQDLKNEDYTFTVNEKHKLEGKKGNIDLGTGTALNDFVVGKYESEKDGNTQLDLVFYYAKLSAKGVSKFITEATKVQYIVGGETEKSEADPDDTKYYTPSFVFMYETGMYISIYKHNSTAAATYTGYSTSWSTTKVGTELVAKLGTVTVKGENVDFATDPVAYKAGVIKNFKGVLNRLYDEAKTKNFWMTTGIYAGVDTLIIVVYGLLIFLMTRGKRNMFNFMKFHQCLKISMEASFTPGLLALILGFLLTQYAYIFFIVLSGIRVMWLTMKQFKPTY